jgi:thiamine biosynthesis lipoprotein
VSIDLSGIAKGFAVDRAVDVLRAHGVGAGLVNAGGDLAAFGRSPWSVHLRDPRDPRRLLCRRDLTDAALASTGLDFDPLHTAQAAGSAIIDPRSGGSVGAIIGASVCAPSCMIADALTKVVMIAGEGALALLEQHAASAMLVTADGDVRATADWQDTDLAA